MIKKAIFICCICVAFFMEKGCKQIEKVNVDSLATENQIMSIKVDFNQIEPKTMRLSGVISIRNKTNKAIQIVLQDTRISGVTYTRNTTNKEITIALYDIQLNCSGQYFSTLHDDPFDAFLRTEIPPNETAIIPVCWFLKGLSKDQILVRRNITLSIHNGDSSQPFNAD